MRPEECPSACGSLLGEIQTYFRRKAHTDNFNAASLKCLKLWRNGSSATTRTKKTGKSTTFSSN